MKQESQIKYLNCGTTINMYGSINAIARNAI